jgi:hypothetical protein
MCLFKRYIKKNILINNKVGPNYNEIDINNLKYLDATRHNFTMNININTYNYIIIEKIYRQNKVPIFFITSKCNSSFSEITTKRKTINEVIQFIENSI